MTEEKLNKMVKSMMRIHKEAIKKSESWVDDTDMVQMYRDDAEDYKLVAELIRDGYLQSAAQTVYNMDTAARDEIAIYVYDELMKHY